MSDYHAIYERRFVRNLSRYSSLKKEIRRCVDGILDSPYAQTEFLDDVSGKLNLKGCRSRRVNRNFRIIFVVCEECRSIAGCEYCFCENLADKTIVFLTVGPHDKAYAMK